MSTKTKDWQFRWKNWVRPTAFPGLWELREGGYFYRRKVKDPTTGKDREAKGILRDVDEPTAVIKMQEAVLGLKSGTTAASQLPKKRFAACALAIFEDKKQNGDFKSAATIEKWKDVLEHLMAGSPPPPPPPEQQNPRYKHRTTKLQRSGMKVAGLGEVYVDLLEEPIKQWRKGINGLIQAGVVRPSTANSWLDILRVITKSIAYDYKLPNDPCERVKDFDESEYPTYTEEEPNALPPERAGEFLEHLFRMFPQHYGMTYLGFVTGLRPSMMRPLRRNGHESDVKWDKNRLVVRRSHTLRTDVMGTTKAGKQYAIDLPEDVIGVLEWHVETQLRRPEQRKSDLLFPSTTGGFRGRDVLAKPFQAVMKVMGLRFRLTTKGMRRTFQDMHRLAKIAPLVTRSICGHATEQMTNRYSTVQNEEQRESIAQVIGKYGPPSTQKEKERSTQDWTPSRASLPDEDRA